MCVFWKCSQPLERIQALPAMMTYPQCPPPLLPLSASHQGEQPLPAPLSVGRRTGGVRPHRIQQKGHCIRGVTATSHLGKFRERCNINASHLSIFTATCNPPSLYSAAHNSTSTSHKFSASVLLSLCLTLCSAAVAVVWASCQLPWRRPSVTTSS